MEYVAANRMNAIKRLTPYMEDYAGEFADDGNINWLPYVMYFHPYGYRSKTVNTDEIGFRYSDARGERLSVGNLRDRAAVRLIAGSSTVFGIGASADRHTLASRMTERDDRGAPWINFGGRSFNSTQELMLFVLHRHRLPKVEEIVLFSGFNNLGLARLPASLRMDHGAFFMCRDFFDAMARKKPSSFTTWFRRAAAPAEPIPTLQDQIDYATDLTLRHLDVWRALAADLGAPLTFVLQPLANWVREAGSPEEQALFGELDKVGQFSEAYGDILTPASYRAYATRLREGAGVLGVPFVDMAEVIAQAVRPDQWVFVDRIHFTDEGHDFVSQLLLDATRAAQATQPRRP
jgi:hypothetical protein